MVRSISIAIGVILGLILISLILINRPNFSDTKIFKEAAKESLKERVENEVGDKAEVLECNFKEFANEIKSLQKPAIVLRSGKVSVIMIKSMDRAISDKLLNNIRKTHIYRGWIEYDARITDVLAGYLKPVGGDATMREHDDGNVQSEFLSWTTDELVAFRRGTTDGMGNPIKGYVTVKEKEPQDKVFGRHGEFQVITEGIIKGGFIIIPVTNDRFPEYEATLFSMGLLNYKSLRNEN